MSRYIVRYIHRAAPRADDTCEAELPDGAFADSKSLGAALRAARLLCKGERLRGFRVEGDRVVCFPDRGIWHSLILTCTGVTQ